MRFHHITLSPGCRVSLTGAPYQHTCDLPSTRLTRPPQDQTTTVYFSGNIRHGGHVTTVGTPHVVQDTLLDVRGDSVPEYLCYRGEGWLHMTVPFPIVCWAVGLHHTPSHRSRP